MKNFLQIWGVIFCTFGFADDTILPHEIKKLFHLIKENTSTHLGFHAHNNLNFALANTITAIKSGVEYIDASIGGIGKGMANLPTEVLIDFLKRNDSNSQYDYVKVLETSEYFKHHIPHAKMDFESKDTLMEDMNFPIDYYSQI